MGATVESPPPVPPALTDARGGFFANSTGAYGATPIASCACYSAFGRPDRATLSWSMTKAITCTVIGRSIHNGWLGSVWDPAPAPLWRDPRSIHRLITLDHLLRMRSGLGFPVQHDDGRTTLGFENSSVYQDAMDAFEAAKTRSSPRYPARCSGISTPVSTYWAPLFAIRSPAGPAILPDGL